METSIAAIKFEVREIKKLKKDSLNSWFMWKGRQAKCH